MSGIRLSKKHGANPSLGQCFWCGGDDGTVLLVGRLPGDAEAPRRMFVSYEPCDTCKEQLEQGVALVEAVGSPVVEGQPPIQKTGAQELYPTGRYMVVKVEAIRRLLTPDVVETTLEKRKAYVDGEAYEKLIQLFREAGEIPQEGDDDAQGG